MAELSYLDRLKSRLDMYYAAEESILGGSQSYKIGTRELTRANLQYIKEMIEYLEKEVAIEQARLNGQGRNRVIGVIPRDF